MLAVVVAAFASLYLTPARNYLGNVQTVKGWLLSLGWVGPAVWMGIVFLMVAPGTPRLLFCPIGGLAFGFWYGLLWTQAATLAGYYVLFLFVRWGGRDFVLRHWPRVGRLSTFTAILQRSWFLPRASFRSAGCSSTYCWACLPSDIATFCWEQPSEFFPRPSRSRLWPAAC